MAGNFLGGIEIFREEGGGHDQCLPCVAEALSGRPIHREFLRRIKLWQAGEVADGVGVFRIGKPAQHNGPGVAGIFTTQRLQCLLRPLQQLRTLLLGWLRLFLRRHFPGGNLLQNALPDFRKFTDRGFGKRLLHIQIPFLLFRGMAFQAILLKHRADGGIKIDGRANVRSRYDQGGSAKQEGRTNGSAGINHGRNIGWAPLEANRKPSA